MAKILILDEVDIRNIPNGWECYKRDRNTCFIRKEIEPLRIVSLSADQKQKLFPHRNDPFVVHREIYPFSMAHNFGGPFFEHYGLLIVSHEFDFKKSSSSRKGQRYERIPTGKFVVTLAGNDDRMWVLRNQSEDQYKEIIKFFESATTAPHIHEVTNKFEMEGI